MACERAPESPAVCPPVAAARPETSVTRMLIAAALIAATPLPALGAEYRYPPAPRVDHVDTYHGVEVWDPYRWLEDNESEPTRNWVAAQNRLTRRVIDGMPAREPLRERMTELWSFARRSAPGKAAGRYLYTANDGLQDQDVLYVQELLEDPPRALIDPNTLSEDGTVSLTQWKASADGRWLAWGLARSGSDWNEFRVRDIDTGEDSPEVLSRIKFSGIAWTRDSRGFFYSRYPQPPSDDGDGVFDALANQRLYYHRVGTPQSEDRLVLEVPDQPKWGFAPTVTDDGRYLVVSIWRGSENVNGVWVLDMESGEQPVLDGEFRRLVPGFEASWVPIGSHGSRLYLVTDLDAPRKRIVSVDLARPGEPSWQSVVPESRDVLKHALRAGKQIVAVYMQDAAERIRRFGLDGRRLRDIELPGHGRLGVYGSSTASNIKGSSGDPELFFAYSDFSRPLTVYRADLETGEQRVFFEPELGFDPDDYVTRQVFFTSRDGTRVPMFVSHRRDLEPDTDTRALLHAYGGFDVSLTPWFSVPYFALMEAGGVFAVANIRGGGEYGREWHEAGIQLDKQNVFDDFIAAAGYLVGNELTRPERLAITGRSNGGLLMGAVLNQRPWLFGAVVADVGVMDMLRFHKFTIGWAWTGDYGSSDDPDQFPVLRGYSPYHNLRPGTEYPAVLVTTGDHDDRVVPGHSYKYTARLQSVQAGDDPVLIRVDTAAGHAAGKPVSKQIEEHVDRIAFMWHFTGD